MKVLLRHSRTRLYVGGSDQWTARREEAWDFEKTFQALQHASEHQLYEVEFVYAFPDSALDMTSPVFPHGQADPGPATG